MWTLVAGCADSDLKPVDKEGLYMGTVISERIYGAGAQKAADKVMNKMKQIEDLMTLNKTGSDVVRLNAKAGAGKVTLNKETFFVLKTAKDYAGLSMGAFDVSIGPLVKAWGVYTDHPRVPTADEINVLKDLVNFDDILLDEKEGTAMLRRKGQVVDLGGIAKGYAGDAAIEILREQGIQSGFVNLGGNVVTLGGKPDGSPWSIGVQNPRAANGTYLGVLKVKDKAVVSSGDYERYFEKDGVRYHHILDPKTGYPADSGLMATTIVADSSIVADVLSTSVFVLGLDEGMKLIESMNGVEALFITEDKMIYTTKGMADIFTFADESKEFSYVEKR